RQRLPRQALRRADILRRILKQPLPRRELLLPRHPRFIALQTRHRIAGARVRLAARLERARLPETEQRAVKPPQPFRLIAIPSLILPPRHLARQADPENVIAD